MEEVFLSYFRGRTYLFSWENKHEANLPSAAHDGLGGHLDWLRDRQRARRPDRKWFSGFGRSHVGHPQRPGNGLRRVCSLGRG